MGQDFYRIARTRCYGYPLGGIRTGIPALNFFNIDLQQRLPASQSFYPNLLGIGPLPGPCGPTLRRLVCGTLLRRAAHPARGTGLHLKVGHRTVVDGRAKKKPAEQMKQKDHSTLEQEATCSARRVQRGSQRRSREKLAGILSRFGAHYEGVFRSLAGHDPYGEGG